MCIARAGVRAIRFCAAPDGVFLHTGCLQNKHGELDWQRFESRAAVHVTYTLV